MRTRTLRSDTLLLFGALIWGFAFVAQKAAMEHVGPFTFNAVRFCLGAIVLVPLLAAGRRKGNPPGSAAPHASRRTLLAGSAAAGLIVFLGATFQQVGILSTTAGKAGFITGLYVVLVPIVGLFLGQRTGLSIWIGAALAAAGLYLLSVTGRFGMDFGDLLVLAGAFCWAAHVQIIAWLSLRMNPIRIAFVQFMACAGLSAVVALVLEDVSIAGLEGAAVPILYAGVLSVGIAYTLQIVAQKEAHPGHAAILMSTEAVFAALGGQIFLGERIDARGLAGCALMLAGMVVSQLGSWRRAPGEQPPLSLPDHSGLDRSHSGR
jgi:drug/metabolite transporter (DMT)-like permease